MEPNTVGEEQMGLLGMQKKCEVLQSFHWGVDREFWKQESIRFHIVPCPCLPDHACWGIVQDVGSAS